MGYRALTQSQLAKVQKLKDPIIDLILINGWRRDGIRQAIINYIEGNDYVLYTPKKHIKPHMYLLTEKEQELLKELKIVFRKPKKGKNGKISYGYPSYDAFSRAINRHFECISEDVGFLVRPHDLRKTMATSLSRSGISRFTIKEALNHKHLSTTEKYIEPSAEDILEIKQMRVNLKTLDGMTIQEWKQLHLRDIKIIRRLEAEIERMQNDR